MTPAQLKAARHELGLSLWQMATALGYQGTQRRQMMDDLETGRRPIREPQRRLVEAMLAGWRPMDWKAITASEGEAFVDEWSLRQA